MPIILENPIPGQSTSTIGWWGLSARNLGGGQFQVSAEWGPVDTHGAPLRDLATVANSGSVDFSPAEVAAFVQAGVDPMILGVIQAHCPQLAGAVT